MAEEFTAFFQLLHHLNTFDTPTIATVKIGPRWTQRETRNGGAEPQVFSQKSTYFKADAFILKKPEIKQALKVAWDEALLESSTEGLPAFVHAWKCLCLQAKNLQYAEVAKLSNLETLQGELEELAKTEKLSQVNQERIVILSEQIAQLEAWRDFRWRAWSKERFLELVDTNSPYFLRKFRARNQKNRISVLNVDDGTRVTDESGIVRSVYSYYSNIFSSPDPVTSPTAPSDFLRVFQGRLTPQHALFMDSLPSHGEFTDVMLNSARGKATGIDGCNVDALQVVWDFVGPVYSSAMQYCWLNGTFPLGFIEGVITLVPKASITEGGFARVLVNSRVTPDFPIARGVRQGCPLAPLLFVLITSSLIWHAEDQSTRGRIKRLTLRSIVDGLPVISAFADDTAFLTSTDPDSFIALFQLLELFGSVSGCRVNWDKTKHISLGKYKAPPDWLLNYQFISLAKTQGTRYLGAFLANKARPSDVWEFVSRKLAKRLHGFSAKVFKFEAKVVIVRFLLQAILSFSIALTRLRLADLHKFERLFAVYLWGSTADGKAKTALAAWVYVAKPLTLGGLGIWKLRVFQKALVIKLILNSIEDMELLWSDLLWNSLLRSNRGSRLRFLFLEDVFPSFQMAPFTKFVFSTCVEIRNFWRWKPQHRLLPSLEPLCFLIQLLCKAGAITVDHSSELLTLLEDFLDTPAYALHADSCLDRIPELADWGFIADFWNFQQDEWVLHSPISTSAEGFPLTVKGVHTLLSEVDEMDTLSRINIRWLMDLTVGIWVAFFRALWSSGLHRRDGLWRIIFRSFFTGARASSMGVSEGTCLFCASHLEDVSHLFYLCLSKAQFWQQVAFSFPQLLGFVTGLLAGQPFPLTFQIIMDFTRGSRLFYALFISRLLRLLWKLRCSFMFEGVCDVGAFHKPLIQTVEMLLSQFRRSGRSKRELAKRALVASLHGRAWIPEKYMLQITAILQG
ncbi:hypothetical protein R1sor_020065 [Riccia sorocarpa]|uniref:Reverse transcriptase domain-containing protein n=1 Tax=Riccia sorocarpa TaxID=122646 RepID=A0ABD3IE98_9MARC